MKKFNSQSPKFEEKEFVQDNGLENFNFNIMNAKGITNSNNLMKAIQAGL